MERLLTLSFVLVVFSLLSVPRPNDAQGYYGYGLDNDTEYYYYYYGNAGQDAVPEPQSMYDLTLFLDSNTAGYFMGGCYYCNQVNDSSNFPTLPEDDAPSNCSSNGMWDSFLQQAQDLQSQLGNCYDPEAEILNRIHDLWTSASCYFESAYDEYGDDADCFVLGWNQVNNAIFNLFFEYRTIPNDCPSGEPVFMLDTDVCCDVDNGSRWWSNLTIPWLTTTSFPPNMCLTSTNAPPIGRRATGPPCYTIPPSPSPPMASPTPSPPMASPSPPMMSPTPSPPPPPPIGRRQVLASVTSKDALPSPRAPPSPSSSLSEREMVAREDPACPDREPGSNATVIGPLGTNGQLYPPSDSCIRPSIPPPDRMPDSLSRAFPNEAAWRAYQRLRQERLEHKIRNRNVLRGFNQPKGSPQWNAARDLVVNEFLKNFGAADKAYIADLVDRGAIRFEFQRNSPFLDRIVIKNEVWLPAQGGGAFTILEVLMVGEADAGANSPNTLHEAAHEVTRMVRRAIFGDLSIPPGQLATQQQLRDFIGRFLLEEIVSQTRNIGRDGSTWAELSRNLETDYVAKARDILIANKQATNGPDMAAAKTGALNAATEVIAALQRMEQLGQTLIDRGLLANRDELSRMMRRMLRSKSTPEAFLEVWKGLTQEQLIKLAERVPVEQWNKLKSQSQILNILNRSALKHALIRHGPGVVGAGFAFALLELYVTDGFDKEKWHEILPKPVPFLPFSMSGIFKGIIPKRWLAYQTQDLGTVGTAFAVTVTTSSELLLLVGYDKLLTPAVCWGLRGVGATRAAAILGRFGIMRILGPVTIPFMAWFAPEMVGAPSVLAANTEQTFRMSTWAVLGGAMGGGFATGGPLGAVAGAFVGAVTLFGRALVEYNNVIREGEERVRRMGVHITMMHARNGLMRHDNLPDNTVIAEARKYFTDYAQGVLLALLMDNNVVTVERLQQMQPGEAIRIYTLCQQLQSSPGSSSKQRELNRIITGQDAVDTALTARVNTYFTQAQDYYDQMERVYKRAVRIHYEPEGNRWRATHDLITINDAFRNAGMGQAAPDAQRDWIVARLPLIADLLSPERAQTGGYLANYAPDIYNCRFCRELRTNFTNMEDLANQARYQLSQPWVLRRLGPAMGTLWLGALNGERSLTDDQLKECMRLLNTTVECPTAQRRDEQTRRARAFNAFNNRTTGGGNRRELPWDEPTLDRDVRLLRAQILLGGGNNQMEPTITEAGEGGRMLVQYDSSAIIQFRIDETTGKLMVAAYRSASPSSFAPAHSTYNTGFPSPPAPATSATYFDDTQFILDHSDDLDGFLATLEDTLQVNGGAEMEWQQAQWSYYGLQQLLLRSEIYTSNSYDAIFLVLHAFTFADDASRSASATSLNSVWTTYWHPAASTNAPENNTHMYRFLQMMIFGIQKLQGYGLSLTTTTMTFVVDGLRNYATQGFPTLPV